MGLHRGRCLAGNKRFFTCGTLETSEKSLDPCSKDSHSLSLLQRKTLYAGNAFFGDIVHKLYVL